MDNDFDAKWHQLAEEVMSGMKEWCHWAIPSSEWHREGLCYSTFAPSGPWV